MHPGNCIHPGEILREEFLSPAGITQSAFADVLGWSSSRLGNLVRRRRGISADAALNLAKALGTSAKLWMNLQATWDLYQAMKRRKAA